MDFTLHYAVGVDGLSLAMVMLTAFLFLVAALVSWRIELRPREYFAWMLILETSLLGVFSALDFVLFFLFWEIELIPMYFLISIWGTGRKQYSAWKYVLYTLTGSGFMLVGLLVLGFTAGTFDIRELAQTGEIKDAIIPAQAIFLLIITAFADQAAGGAVPHLAAGRPHGRADGGERDPGRRAPEDGRLRHPAAEPFGSCRSRRATSRCGWRRWRR